MSSPLLRTHNSSPHKYATASWIHVPKATCDLFQDHDMSSYKILPLFKSWGPHTTCPLPTKLALSTLPYHLSLGSSTMPSPVPAQGTIGLESLCWLFSICAINGVLPQRHNKLLTTLHPHPPQSYLLGHCSQHTRSVLCASRGQLPLIFSPVLTQCCDCKRLKDAARLKA